MPTYSTASASSVTSISSSSDASEAVSSAASTADAAEDVTVLSLIFKNVLKDLLPADPFVDYCWLHLGVLCLADCRASRCHDAWLVGAHAHAAFGLLHFKGWTPTRLPVWVEPAL